MLGLFTGLLGITVVSAQVTFPVVPATPKNFKTREIGNGAEVGATIDAIREVPNVRYVTHVILYENRVWTNAEGKPLDAKLIAFEDMIATAPQGAPAPPTPAQPTKLTVTRDGNARLLVGQKPVVVALASLSRQDQDFVADIQAAVAKKTLSGK